MTEQAVQGSTASVGAEPGSGRRAKRLLAGFVSGFLSVVIFHQALLGLLASSGFVAANAYSTAPTAPFGVPQLLSTAFWGGVWGTIFLALQARFPRGAGYWLAALAFGAILPSLVAWFVVAPLKGAPVLAGGDVHRIVTALLINGAWGVGTAVLIWLAGAGQTRATQATR